MSFLSSRNFAENACLESFIDKLAVVKNCLFNNSGSEFAPINLWAEESFPFSSASLVFSRPIPARERSLGGESVTTALCRLSAQFFVAGGVFLRTAIVACNAHNVIQSAEEEKEGNRTLDLVFS